MNEREEIMAGSIYKQARTSAADKLTSTKLTTL
jgi:hypothetical protein